MSGNKPDVPPQLDQLTKLVDTNNNVAALKLTFRNLQTQL